MKKISRISLHQLDKAELDKKQQGLLFGGGDPGWCKCGSCTGKSGAAGSNYNANMDANMINGYTITGSNEPICVCSGGLGSSSSTAFTPSK